MRKLQSFLSKIAGILKDFKTQGALYLQKIGEDRSTTADDEIAWEDGEDSAEGPAVL